MMTIEDREGKEHRIKSEISELTLREYDEFSMILANQKLNNMERIIELCRVCGLPKAIGNSIGYKTLVKIYRAMGLEKKVGLMESDIVLDGYHFTVPQLQDGELDLSGSDMITIENIINDSELDKSARIMNLLLCLDVAKSPGELLDNQRLKLIKEHMRAGQSSPFTTRIYGDIVETFTKL